MSSLVNQVLTPEVMFVLYALIAVLIILWILSIVWVARDARLRGTNIAFAVLAIIPIVGVIAYCMLRPALSKADREEQDLELAIKQRELMKYGECSHCGYPVEEDYVMCPNCHQRLKNLCPTCHHALRPEWSVCPYCTTPINGGRPRQASGNAGQTIKM